MSKQEEKTSITRQQASDLFVALARLESGLGASNAITVADNINTLHPVVSALDKGKVAAQRQINALPENKDRPAEAQRILDELEARAEQVVDLPLERLDISGDEVVAAKIAPRDLAVIRRWLRKA